MKTRRWYFQWGTRRLGTRRLGIGTSRVLIRGEPYLDRFILFLGGPTLRLHRFWRGDDDRASHTHPFWFITVPLSAYWEAVYHKGQMRFTRRVRWPSFRSRTFEHRVILLGRVPCWTLVFTGAYSDDWGFYPSLYEYVPNEAYHD